jgi:hypothetical protein
MHRVNVLKDVLYVTLFKICYRPLLPLVRNVALKIQLYKVITEIPPKKMSCCNKIFVYTCDNKSWAFEGTIKIVLVILSKRELILAHNVFKQIVIMIMKVKEGSNCMILLDRQC